MSEEFIKEAKNFRMQMKWCAIIALVSTALLTYTVPEKAGEWGIITFGGIVFTFIYFNMNKNIKEYEKLKK
jgi:hypothetical protein